MSFNNSFTAVTGATYTAAQYNTYVRDNLTAIWVYTTQGDLAYATSASTLARLAIGSVHKVLRSTGSAPSWDDVLQKCVLYKSADQTYSSGSSADIVWEAEKQDSYGWHNPASNPERITVIEAGWYVPFVKLYFNKNTGGSGTCHLNSAVKINTFETLNAVSIFESIDAVTKKVTYGGHAIQMSAGQYLTADFAHDMGADGKLISGLTNCSFSVYRVG